MKGKGLGVRDRSGMHIPLPFIHKTLFFHRQYKTIGLSSSAGKEEKFGNFNGRNLTGSYSVSLMVSWVAGSKQRQQRSRLNFYSTSEIAANTAPDFQNVLVQPWTLHSVRSLPVLYLFTPGPACEMPSGFDPPVMNGRGELQWNSSWREV